MPEMTGAQLAELIKDKWPTLPVILATGFAEMPQTASGLQRLAKPFSQEQLAQRIAQLHIKTTGASVVRLRPGASPTI